MKTLVCILIFLPIILKSQDSLIIKIHDHYPYEILKEAAIDEQGNTFICIYDGGLSILKLDSEGNEIWMKKYMDSVYSSHMGMDVDAQGMCYFGGEISTTPYTNFCYKIDSSGDDINYIMMNFVVGDYMRVLEDIEVVNSNKIVISLTDHTLENQPSRYTHQLRMLDSNLVENDDHSDVGFLGGRITVDESQNIFVFGRQEFEWWPGDNRLTKYDTLLNKKWYSDWGCRIGESGNIILCEDQIHLLCHYDIYDTAIRMVQISDTLNPGLFKEYFKGQTNNSLDIIRIKDTLCLVALRTSTNSNKLTLMIANQDGDSLASEDIYMPEGQFLFGSPARLLKQNDRFVYISDVQDTTGNKNILFLSMSIDSLEYFSVSPPLPVPEAYFIYEKSGSDVYFTDQSSYPEYITGWHWEFGDGLNSDEQNPFHTYINPGIYPVILTITNINSGTSQFCDTVITFSGIPDQLESHQIAISFQKPNDIIIENISKKNLDYILQVLDLGGKVVKEEKIFSHFSGTKQEFYLNNVSNGFYIIHVSTSEEKISKKIIW
jgi:hypothetical protein